MTCASSTSPTPPPLPNYLYSSNPQATAPSNPDNAFDIGAKDAMLVCPFDGTTTCAAAETPSTETGAIRYSGSKSALSFAGWETTASHGNVAYSGNGLDNLPNNDMTIRSEERRVGKECRSRW